MNQKEAKIRLRKVRIPEFGDKLASRHGQKGVVGMIMPANMMPFTKDGLVPDIIINPHAFPSRMTIGHLIESILAKTACVAGFEVDGTAFEKQDFATIAELLESPKYNMYRHGDEVMYNGITGEQMTCDVFIGPTYYFRLKHMVADKINYRREGKVVALTQQPTKGRGNDGGLRIGEMESNVLISHGIASFTKESLMERSDMTEVLISDQGDLTYMDTKRQIMPHDLNRVSKVQMPYAFKLLMQELQTMAIRPKLVTRINEDQDKPEVEEDWYVPEVDDIEGEPDDS